MAIRNSLWTRPRPRGMRALALAAVALAPLSASAQALAPLPPARPSDIGAPRSLPGAFAPEPPRTPAPQAEAPLDPDHPPMLPQASRARMRECGREWQAMKLAGKDVDIGWREFASGCLTR